MCQAYIIGIPGLVLSCFSWILAVYVSWQAKLASSLDSNQYHYMTLMLIFGVACSDWIFSCIFEAQLCLSTFNLDATSDSWCEFFGILQHYTSIFSIFWHWLVALYTGYISLHQKTKAKYQDCLNKFQCRCCSNGICQKSGCVFINMVILIMVLTLLSIILSKYLLNEEFGERCLFRDSNINGDDDCVFQECWLSEAFDWFWIIIGMVALMLNISVVIKLCYEIYCSKKSDIKSNRRCTTRNPREILVKQSLLLCLLPWLITYVILRLPAIIMRIYLHFTPANQFSFGWVIFLVISVSTYGIGTFIAWICTYCLLLKFDQNRPNPQESLLNQLENHSHDPDQFLGPNNSSGYTSEVELSN